MSSRSGRPFLIALVLAVLTIVALAGCGGDDDDGSAPPDCHRIRNGKVTLVAENIMWDKTCLRVEQGTEVTFTADYRDTSVDHNLEVYGPEGKKTTELVRGPAKQTLVYDFSQDGLHHFDCKIHANMEGVIWVDPS